MRKLARFFEVAILVLMVGLCVLVLFAGSGKMPYVFGYRVLQVISGSMQPTISDETCIVIKKVDIDEIEIGDIITFVSESPDIYGFLNTHRVHNIVQDAESGETLFITKGDAYDKEDAYPVEYEQIKGKYVGELPLGKLIFKGIRFLSDQNHYFLIVILPLSLCCVSYVKQIFESLTGKQKEEQEEKEEQEKKED